jgi:hypothetical protein
MLKEAASRSGCGGSRGADRICVGLAGKVVVKVKVCVKNGSKICSEDGFRSGF